MVKNRAIDQGQGSGSNVQSSRKDPAWKYGIQVDGGVGGKKSYVYVKCKFCNKTITGGVKRLKDHLGGTHKNVSPCPKVPDEVKQEMIAYMKGFEEHKHANQKFFDEMVDSGSYYGAPMEMVNSCGGSGSSGSGPKPRGPMDRFLGRSRMSSGDGSTDKEDEVPQKMSRATLKEQRNLVCLDIGRFFFENAIAFNVARSPSYFNMLRSVGNYGVGLSPPTMHEIRTWILKEEYKTTTKLVEDVKKTWKHTGVSILSDGWSDVRNRGLINILVNNPHGTVFLRSIDASDQVKNAEYLFTLLDGVVEEVGEELVVQVVTDNASAYKAAGKMLMEKRKHLYWTPCAAHCLDLILEKLGELPQHKNALQKAKKVSNFIYNHGWVLQLMRKFAKRDLVRPAATRFATAYLTLESLGGVKAALQRMFVSKQWSGCRWANKSEGKEAKKIIMDERSFWPSVAYAIKTTKPLVEVLRLVDGEKEPAMGFIYGAMDSAKEKIAENLGNQYSAYNEIWKIIDEKWEHQLHRDLHAAAYYLNPQFKWEDGFSTHAEIKQGLYDCMDRLLPDSATFNMADSQLDEYRYKRGFFGMRAAQNSYKTRPPVEWWDHFGDQVPELRALAMKILGLTCSSSACERNWSTFNQVHTKRRNRLSTTKLNSLVFIMYNKKLKFRKTRLLKKDEDVLVNENLSSDDEWIAEPNDDENTEVGEEELDLDVDEMANEMRGVQLIDDIDEDEEENGPNDMDGDDATTNLEHDMSNDPISLED